MGSIFLSLIIPVYNEERRLPSTLENLCSFLGRQTYQAEVLLVENGSSDGTFALAQAYAQRYPQVHVLRAQARGKGLAVKMGMLAASGQYCFMCDADFSMPVSEINRFLPPQLPGCEIAIASREAPGAVRYNEPQYRHLVGRLYNFLIRMIAIPGLHDTQCGFKCFRADIARKLFRRQTIAGWSFDVEILFMARQLGYQIVEIPIPWYFNPDSKISVVRDSIRMALDLLHIRVNGRRGVYRLDEDQTD